MSVRHFALPFVVSITLAISGCDTISSGVEKVRSVAGPSAKNVSLSEPNQEGLSTNQGEMDWRVRPAPSPCDGRPVNLGDAISGGWRPWGAAVSPSGRAVVTYTNPRDRSDGNSTRMAVVDVEKGQVESAWEVPDLVVPLDLDPAGTTVILCRQDRSLSDRETLYLYEMPRDGSPVADVWRPLNPDGTASRRGAEIRWVKFAGPEIVVTLSDAGTIHVWDFPSKTKLVSIPNVVGTPCVSPDGTRVAFLTDDMLALLDPNIPGVVAVRRVGPLPRNPLIAFRPDGQKLVITGPGKTTVLDLATGQLTHSEMSRSKTNSRTNLMPDLAWIGHFLYQEERLYDLNSPHPLWHFSGIEWAMPEANRLWTILRSKTTKQYVLQPVELPLDQVETQLEKYYSSSDVIAVKPGDKVRIDVSGIPSSHQAEVLEHLQQRLVDSGFEPSDQAFVLLRASIDRPKQAAATYVNFAGSIGPPLADAAAEESRTYYYYRQPARLQFIQGNRVVWSTTQYIFPPVWLQEWPQDQFLADHGGPDFSLYQELKLPTYLRGFRSSVLGRTQLWAD